MDISFLWASNQSLSDGTITDHVNSTKNRTAGLATRIGVYSFVVGVHVCGVILLGCLWKASRARVRHLLLMNLSVFVIFFNLLEICSTAEALSGYIRHSHKNSYHVVTTMMLPLIEIPTLFFINTDRLLEVNIFFFALRARKKDTILGQLFVLSSAKGQEIFYLLRFM